MTLSPHLTGACGIDEAHSDEDHVGVLPTAQRNRALLHLGVIAGDLENEVRSLARVESEVEGDPVLVLEVRAAQRLIETVARSLEAAQRRLE